MELFTYDVKSKNKLFLGRQYDHKSAVISFSGFKVDDPNDFVYLKLGEPVGKKYLLGDDLSVTITSEMTAKPAVMRGQLIEYRTTAEAEDEASYIKSSPVFYCQVAQSIRAEGTPDATDPTIDSAYAKIQGYEESAKASAETAKQAAEDASKVTVDVKNKVDKVRTATVGHMAIFTDDGNIADGGLPKGTDYTAGDNVQINGAVISATDTTYTAGDNVTISGNVISAKDTTYTAGANITIENGVISSSGGGSGTSYIAGDNISISGNVISATDTTYTAGADKYSANADIVIEDNVIYFDSTEIYNSITSLRQDAGDWAEENATKISSNSTAIKNLSATSHMHTNMSVLKQITADDLTSWNTAYTNSHTHTNKDVLDGIVSTDVTNWNTAYTNSHAHANKDVLDTLTADSIHTHTNKDILDGITSEKIGFWNTAYTNNHTHSNKSVLDGITSTLVTNWNTAYTNARYLTNSSVLKGITSTNVTSWNNKADKTDLPVAGTDYVTPATAASTYATLASAFLARTDTITDANNVPYGFGMYTVESTCSNIPSAQQYWLLSFLNDNGNGIQFARRTTKASGNYNQFYMRIKISGGWDTWVCFETI